VRYLVCSATRACFIVTTSAIAMSTPTMNHTHQQQQQQINEIQHANLNSANSPPATMTRSDSTSTVILEEEETRTRRRKGPPTQPLTGWTNLSTQLRSFLKTSGLFNNGRKIKNRIYFLLFLILNRFGIL
jgi:hypothetical protein